MDKGVAFRTASFLPNGSLFVSALPSNSNAEERRFLETLTSKKCPRNHAGGLALVIYSVCYHFCFFYLLLNFINTLFSSTSPSHLHFHLNHFTPPCDVLSTHHHHHHYQFHSIFPLPSPHARAVGQSADAAHPKHPASAPKHWG